MNLLQRNRLINFDLTLGKYNSFIQNIVDSSKGTVSQYICIANVHMFMEAFRSSEFMKVISNADIITPDGKPLTWGMRLLYGIKQDRVAGSDIVPDLLKELEKSKIPIFFYGGTEYLLNKSAIHLRSEYPQLPVAGMHSPPFRKLTNDETEREIKMINNSGAKVVFVILGCPKQETWMSSMKGRINCMMIGIGGALPIIVGDQKRAPKWMQDFGLEWLFRLVLEPRRLLKRYASTNFAYAYLILKEFLRIKLFRKSLS